MDFRRSGPLDERRRRVLMDEIAAPNEADTSEQAAGGAARGPVRAYGPAVLGERQPRVTELLPVRPLWAVCLILLGLTGIAAIEAIHIHAVTSPLQDGMSQLAALDARQRGSLAGWYSSAMLAAAALLALVTFGIRSHRVDDYRGKYRIWLWVAPAVLWLSVDAATAIHDAIGYGITLLAGPHVVSSSFAGAATLTWIALYGLVLGTLGIRLGLEIWSSLPSFAALCIAALLYLLGGLFELEMLRPAASSLVASVIESTIVMLAHLSLLAAIGLFARHVLLDAGGRLKVHIDPEKKKSRAKTKAKLKVLKDDREAETAKKAVAAPAAKAAQATPAAGGPLSARPGAGISKNSLSSPDDENEDDDDDYGDEQLSKSERRRLKKMARREQRRAA